jgi:SAM-dependent methyltransferase
MVSKWIIKAAVQKTISYLPYAQRVNYFFQKHVTGGVHLTDDHFRLKLQHARDHHQYLLAHGQNKTDLTILELGTGWYPVVPLLFFLTSSGEVISVDIQKWMTRRTQYITLLKFKEWRERGLLDELVPYFHEQRWEQLMGVIQNPSAYDPDQFNKMIGLKPLIQDARHMNIGSESVDFICSNNTFEHIPGEILHEILCEFNRVIKPGGVMSHFIDMSDHFAHFDSHITIYNFLKFSKKTWAFIDNSIQPQNRMRFRDYIEMYLASGLPVSDEIIREGDPVALKRVLVHSEFSDYTEKELAISHATIISRMPR